MSCPKVTLYVYHFVFCTCKILQQQQLIAPKYVHVTNSLFIFIYIWHVEWFKRGTFQETTQRWVRVLISRGGSSLSCPTAWGLACAYWRSRTSTGRLLARSAKAVQRRWPRWSSKGVLLRRRSAPAAQGTLSSPPEVRIFQNYFILNFKIVGNLPGICHLLCFGEYPADEYAPSSQF